MPRLWEESREGQELLSNSSLEKSLIQNLDMLVKSLEFDHTLTTHLLQLRVISPEQLDTIKGLIINTEKVLHLLMSVLNRGTVWQFHAFLRCLALTHRHDLITNMGLDSDLYMDSPIKSSCIFECPACHTTFDNPAILPSCQHYICQSCVQNTLTTSGKTKYIKCPLQDCQAVSVIRDAAMPPYDADLETLCNILGQAPFEKDVCTICNDQISKQKPLHSCNTCDGTLCNKCYIVHQQNKKLKEHETKHNHHEGVCCLHGRPSEQFCRQCSIYCCVLCLSDQCQNHRTVSLDRATPRSNTSASALRTVLKDTQAKIEDNTKQSDSFQKCFNQDICGSAKIEVDSSVVENIIQMVNITSARMKKWEELNGHLLSIIHRPEMREETLVQVEQLVKHLDFSLPPGHQALLDGYKNGLIHWRKYSSASTQTEDLVNRSVSIQTSEVDTTTESSQTETTSQSEQATQTSDNDVTSESTQTETSTPSEQATQTSDNDVTSVSNEDLDSSVFGLSMTSIDMDGFDSDEDSICTQALDEVEKNQEDSHFDFTKVMDMDEFDSDEDLICTQALDEVEKKQEEGADSLSMTAHDEGENAVFETKAEPLQAHCLHSPNTTLPTVSSYDTGKKSYSQSQSSDFFSLSSGSVSTPYLGDTSEHSCYFTSKPLTKPANSNDPGSKKSYSSLGLALTPSMRYYGESSEPAKKSPVSGKLLKEIKLGNRGNQYKVAWINIRSLLIVGNKLDMITFNHDYTSFQLTTVPTQAGPYRYVTTTPTGLRLTCKPNSDQISVYDPETETTDHWQPREVTNIWLVGATEEKFIVTSANNTNIYIYDSRRRFLYAKQICARDGSVSPSDMKCHNGVIIISLWDNNKVYSTTVDKNSPVVAIEGPEGLPFGTSPSVAIDPSMKLLVVDKTNQRLCVFSDRGGYLYTEKLRGEVWDCAALYVDVSPCLDTPHVMAVSTWSPKNITLYICQLSQ